MSFEVDFKTKQVKATAWGVCLTADNLLVRLGTSLSEVQQYPKLTVKAVQLNGKEAKKVEKELNAVNHNRFAPWPTVEQYLPELY